MAPEEDPCYSLCFSLHEATKEAAANGEVGFKPDPQRAAAYSVMFSYVFPAAQLRNFASPA